MVQTDSSPHPQRYFVLVQWLHYQLKEFVGFHITNSANAEQTMGMYDVNGLGWDKCWRWKRVQTHS